MVCEKCQAEKSNCLCNKRHEQSLYLRSILKMFDVSVGGFVKHLVDMDVCFENEFSKNEIDVCGNSPFVTPLHVHVVDVLENNNMWHDLFAVVRLYASTKMLAPESSVEKVHISLTAQQYLNQHSRTLLGAKPFVKMGYVKKGGQR